ncbi:recombinase, partial [Pseudomonas aeruginosa]
MRVFYTDESFELNGVPLPGIPFLANAGAELIESANRYLFHIAVVRGRTRSPATWRTYADHLYEFFSFLEENALFWTRVNQEHIAVWRNSMLDRGLSRSTINKRLSTTSAFYTWCARQGLAEQLPFETQDVL